MIVQARTQEKTQRQLESEGVALFRCLSETVGVTQNTTIMVVVRFLYGLLTVSPQGNKQGEI